LEIFDTGPSFTGKDAGDLRLLLLAMLQQERPAALQEAPAIAGERTDGVEAILAGNESFPRFEAQAGQARIARANVWRVRDDQVEALIRNGGSPGAFQELYIGKPMLHCVVP